jgi:hypothetical protein
MIFQIPAFDVVTLPSLPTLDRRTSETGNADPHARAPVACPALRRAGCAVSYTLPADQAGGRVLVLLDMLWLGHDATPASRRPPRGSGAPADRHAGRVGLRTALLPGTASTAAHRARRRVKAEVPSARIARPPPRSYGRWRFRTTGQMPDRMSHDVPTHRMAGRRAILAVDQGTSRLG